MNIVCVESLGISRERFESLKAHYSAMGHDFTYYMDRREDEATLADRMREADVAVISNIKLPADVLAQCPKLRYLSVAFTGLDHIDLAYCREHGIKVQNAAGYSTTAVSELAVGMMLDLLRNIVTLNEKIRQGGSRGTFLGRELRGKTVGIVGTGANDLLRQSDIVSLHVPLCDETRGLIGERELSLMKPTAMLVNTARGPVCDIAAVGRALIESRIAGAAFDVFEHEPPLPIDHLLLSTNRCLVTPHVAFATEESFAARADIVFGHVDEWLKQ